MGLFTCESMLSDDEGLKRNLLFGMALTLAYLIPEIELYNSFWNSISPTVYQDFVNGYFRGRGCAALGLYDFDIAIVTLIWSRDIDRCCICPWNATLRTL